MNASSAPPLATPLSTPGTVLWPLLAVAYVLRVATAIAWPNIHWPDEIYLMTEHAHRMLFGYGIVTWEWRLGMRPWLIPSVLAVLIGGGDAMGLGPNGYAAIVAMAMSALSLSVVAVGAGLGMRILGTAGALVVGGLCAVWFEMVYFAPKTSTEVIAGHILVIAVWFVLTRPDRLLLIGALLGTCFVVRFHTTPMLAVAALWTCGFDIRRKWPWLILGALIPIGVQAVVDWGTMGLPLQSIWRYFWINIMEQRAAAYGVMPTYWYLGRLLVIWGPILPFLLVAAILGTRRAPLLAAMVVTHVAAHTLIGHKEERLLFPALPLLLILAGLGICEVMSRARIFRRAPGPATAVTLLCLAALSVFGGARDGFAGNWSKMSGGLYATDFLRERQDVCGIGLLHGPGWLGYWFPSGGYYRLHRPVPFFIGEDAGELAKFAPGFNYASLPQPIGDQLQGYERLRCWPGEMNSSRTADTPSWCVYRRTGACAADAPRQINDRLRELGE